MLRQIVFLFAVLFSANAYFNDTNKISDAKKIIGGVVTKNVGEFSYQATVQQRVKPNSNVYQHKCGGALITTRHVLSASHCYQSQLFTYLGPFAHTTRPIMINANEFVVGLGAKDLFVVKDWYRIKSIDAPLDVRNDIAILTLINEVQLSPAISIIPLPPPDFVLQTGSKSVVSGFGLTQLNVNIQNHQLRSTVTTIIPKIHCAADTMSGPNTICARSHFRISGSCMGDSGGPLVYNGMIVGVVSRGPIACTHYEYYLHDIYTNVMYYRKYIDAVIRETTPMPIHPPSPKSGTTASTTHRADEHSSVRTVTPARTIPVLNNVSDRSEKNNVISKRVENAVPKPAKVEIDNDQLTDDDDEELDSVVEQELDLLLEREMEELEIEAVNNAYPTHTRQPYAPPQPQQYVFQLNYDDLPTIMYQLQELQKKFGSSGYPSKVGFPELTPNNLPVGGRVQLPHLVQYPKIVY